MKGANLALTKKLAIGSILIGALVLALKLWAWQITGSVAVYSDALESTVNVVAAIIAFLAVSYAARPADDNHPYGHYKAEYVSAAIEGAMIIIAAILIFISAWQRLQAPAPINTPSLGLLVLLLSSTINATWSFILIKNGRKLHSPALIADGKHLRADVISSIAVALGVFLAVVTGIEILDPILAFLVAIHILYSGMHVVTSSFSGLMDEAVSDEVLKKIENVISQNATGAIEAHDLRTRKAAKLTYIDFHLVVDGETSVSAAHDICDRLEDALKKAVPHAQVSIHVEPDDKAKHGGINIA